MHGHTCIKLSLLLEYDRIALSAFVGCGTNVFSSIGYSKFVCTMDKVIHKWGHVTEGLFSWCNDPCHSS